MKLVFSRLPAVPEEYPQLPVTCTSTTGTEGLLVEEAAATLLATSTKGLAVKSRPFSANPSTTLDFHSLF